MEQKLGHLAELTGVSFTGSDAEKAKVFIDEIRAMNKRMEIPTGFDFIREKDIPQMIGWPLAEANPIYPCRSSMIKNAVRRSSAVL